MAANKVKKGNCFFFLIKQIKRGITSGIKRNIIVQVSRADQLMGQTHYKKSNEHFSVIRTYRF